MVRFSLANFRLNWTAIMGAGIDTIMQQLLIELQAIRSDNQFMRSELASIKAATVAPVSLEIGTTEAAKILGRTPQTIRVMVADGRLKSTNNDGNDLRFNRAYIVKKASGAVKHGRPRKIFQK